MAYHGNDNDDFLRQASHIDVTGSDEQAGYEHPEMFRERGGVMTPDQRFRLPDDDDDGDGFGEETPRGGQYDDVTRDSLATTGPAPTLMTPAPAAGAGARSTYAPSASVYAASPKPHHLPSRYIAPVPIDNFSAPPAPPRNDSAQTFASSHAFANSSSPANNVSESRLQREASPEPQQQQYGGGYHQRTASGTESFDPFDRQYGGGGGDGGYAHEYTGEHEKPASVHSQARLYDYGATSYGAGDRGGWDKQYHQQHAAGKRRTNTGRGAGRDKKKWFVLGGVLVAVIVAISLGLGLGLGGVKSSDEANAALSSADSSSSSSSSSSASSSAASSTAATSANVASATAATATVLSTTSQTRPGTTFSTTAPSAMTSTATDAVRAAGATGSVMAIGTTYAYEVSGSSTVASVTYTIEPGAAYETRADANQLQFTQEVTLPDPANPGQSITSNVRFRVDPAVTATANARMAKRCAVSSLSAASILLMPTSLLMHRHKRSSSPEARRH